MVLILCDNTTLILQHRLKQFIDQYFIELRAEDESTGGPKYCDFLEGVAMFDLVFLGHFFTKIRSFCAHQTENFLNFSKITLLLSLAQF